MTKLASPFFRTTALTIGITVLASATLTAEEPFNFDQAAGHLPKTIVPHHYALQIEPNLPHRTFAGHVVINLTVREPTATIVLNANALAIDAASIRPASTPRPADVTLAVDLQPELRRLTLTASQPLAPGDYQLDLTYRGQINASAQGMFVDHYPTDSGEKEMFGTQFESIDARRLLPCWDEPAFRATFDVTLIVPERFVAVSNMPVQSEIPLPDARKAVVFAPTPPMSTYLLALFGGEFETVQAEHHGTHLRILTTEGKRASALYALESTKRILDFYADYFGTPYPLPKLDQIGVPNAFAAFGAMENWGCISYIDTALLYDPATSPQSTKEDVFRVVAHEIAHQWFGNLVTMGWWDNLWLNEGFASWMEVKCTDSLNPEWNIWLRSNAEKEQAFALDARLSTHPIQQIGVTENSADDAFDDISYLKGQSFIRMLETYLGEVPFRTGIRHYLQQHALSNTTTADLWNALSESSGQRVDAIAAAWTEQPGFPVVLAALDGEELHLSQQRFIFDDPSPEQLTWSVPVTYAPASELNAVSTCLLNESALTLPWPAKQGPPKLNVGDTGFYRVYYDPTTFARLAAMLPQMPEADQLNLLGDTWALVVAGRSSAADYLDLVLALRETPSQPVWSGILASLDSIDRWQADRPGREAFHRWAAQLLKPHLNRLGWATNPSESPLIGSLRSELVNRLGTYGDPSVIAECQRRFRLFLDDPSSLSADLLKPVLNTVGRYADRPTYDALHRLAQTARTTEEKRRAYGAMQRALDPILAAETLQLTLGDELSSAEFSYNVQRVSVSGEHTALAWSFALENAPSLLARISDFARNGYLPNIVDYSADPDLADALESATVKYIDADALIVAQRTSNLIRIRAAAARRELPAIDAWIDAHQPPTT